jgi:hypothetical protein
MQMNYGGMCGRNVSSCGSDTHGLLLFLSRLASAYPEHPLVTTVNTKSNEFDDLAVKFRVPPLAIPAA